MLILFDIDLTLVDTSGVGIRSLVAGGRRLHGDAFTAQGVEFGGQLDPIIIARMLDKAGVEVTPGAIDAVRDAYVDELTRAIETPDAPKIGRALPGVLALLDALAADAPHITLGLLTGNFEQTGTMKLRACGIDVERFPVRVWGDDSPHTPPARHHLPPVGVERYRARVGRELEPEQVTIVGDTVHDVHAGRSNGHRVLAVATGREDVDTLAAAGADRVVEDLSRTAEVLEWLTNPSQPQAPPR